MLLDHAFLWGNGTTTILLAARICFCFGFCRTDAFLRGSLALIVFVLVVFYGWRFLVTNGRCYRCLPRVLVQGAYIIRVISLFSRLLDNGNGANLFSKKTFGFVFCSDLYGMEGFIFGVAARARDWRIRGNRHSSSVSHGCFVCFDCFFFFIVLHTIYRVYAS